MKTLADVRRILEEGKKTARSAWQKGVYDYALDFVDDVSEYKKDKLENVKSYKELKEIMLNGADSFEDASWGGCFFIYDEDIAERLCNPSELKRTKHGQRRPNRNEDWLDVQARALYQASYLLNEAFFKE